MTWIHIHNTYLHYTYHDLRNTSNVGETILAVGAYMKRRRAASLMGVLSLNAIALPSARCLARRKAPPLEPCLGVQPLDAFSHLANWLEGPLHVCADEVAVNQKVSYLTVKDQQATGYELAGLADRCVREKNTEGVQYIMLQEGGLLKRRTVANDAGDFVTTETTDHSDDPLAGITDVPRATLVCMWILFMTIRGSHNLHVAAIPTRGDLTCADDISMLHLIITQAYANGRVVTCFGTDNAAPHAALQRGIVRRLCKAELSAIVNAAESFIKDTEMTGQGSTDNTNPVYWEPASKAIAPAFQRPISALMDLLAAYHAATGTRSERAQTVLKRQWTIPFPGLPIAAQRCGVSGHLLGISSEWRHDNRLMVSFHLYSVL